MVLYLKVGSFPLHDLLEFSLYAAGEVFDASQYAFFGQDSVEEVELGGLEDEEEAAVGLEEEEFLYNKEEVQPFCFLILYLMIYSLLACF